MQFLNFNYETKNPDSSLKYGLAALELSRKSKNLRAEARTLNGLSGVLRQQGRFAEALEYLFEGRKLAEKINFTYELARNYRRTGMIYNDLNDFTRARDFELQAIILDQSIPGNRGSLMFDRMVLADVYVSLNKLDSAQYFANLVLQNRDNNVELIHLVYLTLGNMYYRKNMLDSALFYYRANLNDAIHYSDFHDVSGAANKIAALYQRMSNRDSAMHYALMAFEFGQRVSYKKSVMQAAAMLADLYDSTDARRSLQYYRISNAAKDSLFGTDNIQVIQNLIGREERSRKEAEDARLAFSNRLRWYGLLSGLLVLLVITWLLYRNNRQKQKANLQLQAQKDEVQTALHQLKTTQSQLIQSEKMASLGELTAGVAHEIQNPLNFVNNFSDLNKELIDDMRHELLAGNHQEAIAISDNIKDNEEKINHHGKRADGIVKNMLQHSRTSAGQKELTNINGLADEYFRLSFHGIRAKDKSFNATLQTDFDPAAGDLHIVPGEIGRVLLNLYNNAFYAVSEKAKKQTRDYEPVISVSTKKNGHQVEIRVRDNGDGVPQKIVDKIFQPFFTTKPTGEGTGLGLSLSYDIIKTHGGEIKVNTKEGNFTEFVVQFPAG